MKFSILSEFIRETYIYYLHPSGMINPACSYQMVFVLFKSDESVEEIQKKVIKKNYLFGGKNCLH